MMTERSRGSVVDITTLSGGGTGWIYRVDQNGKAWILTNEHVVESARTVTVRFEGSGGTKTGTVVGTDARRDIAVVTICCDQNWVPLPIARARDVQAGTEVVILGYPEGRVGSGVSVTTGIISSYGYSSSDDAWLVQTDAAVNPGNSGGPLFNEDGEVIGIVSSRNDPSTSENIGFAIAMRTVNDELDRLESGRTVAVPTPTPSPIRIPEPVITGVSGELVFNPYSENISCSTSMYDNSVISIFTLDTSAFLDFEVPNTLRWSIGFVYHNDGGQNYTSTFIYSEGLTRYYAKHYVSQGERYLHDPPAERISSAYVRTGTNQLNELSFITSKWGTSLGLNGFGVLYVPPSQLNRTYGWSTLCVGFSGDENLRYTIPYSGLWAWTELPNP